MKFLPSGHRKQTNSYVSSLALIASHPLMFSDDLISFQALEKSFHFIPSTIITQSHQQFDSSHSLQFSDIFTSSINVLLSSSFAVSPLFIISFVPYLASQFCHDSIPWNDSMVFQNIDSRNFRYSDFDSSIHLNETIGCDVSIALFVTQPFENSKISSSCQIGLLSTVFDHSQSYSSSHSVVFISVNSKSPPLYTIDSFQSNTRSEIGGENANAKLDETIPSLAITLGIIFASLLFLAIAIIVAVIHQRRSRMEYRDPAEEASPMSLSMDVNDIVVDFNNDFATCSNALTSSGTGSAIAADEPNMDMPFDAVPTSELVDQ
jgi:hypothetical protein